MIEEPLHAYSIVPVPPVALELRCTVPPTHIGPSLLIVAVGTASTVTVVVLVLLQPDTALLTVNVYTDVPVAVGTALVAAVVVEPMQGPLHE